MFENVMHAGLPFYASQVDPTGRKGASLEKKLLPLETLAFGTCIFYYFQMSKALALKCCKEFANMMQCISAMSTFASLMQQNQTPPQISCSPWYVWFP
jgi:hypothetical protein